MFLSELNLVSLHVTDENVEINYSFRKILFYNSVFALNLFYLLIAAVVISTFEFVLNYNQRNIQIIGTTAKRYYINIFVLLLRTC